MHHLPSRARTSVCAMMHWARLGHGPGSEVTKEKGRNWRGWKQLSLVINYQHTGGTRDVLAHGTFGTGVNLHQFAEAVKAQPYRRVPKRRVVERTVPPYSEALRGTLVFSTKAPSAHVNSSTAVDGLYWEKRCLTVILIFIPFFPFTDIAMSIWTALNWYTSFTITMIELC